MKTKLLAVTALLGLMAALLFPAVGRSGAPTRVLPPPGARDSISAYASRLRVGPAQRSGDLVVFPVFASGVTIPDVDLTLDKAMSLGVLEISELASAEVNRVRVHNRAKQPVYIMAGEMLRGAKQDRIVGDDLILPPGEGLPVPVFCVEHGRWVSKTESFKSGRAMAGAGIRQRAPAGQAAVWQEVAGEQARLSAPSATGALSSIHDSAEVQRKIKPYARDLSDLPDDFPKACGVVAAVRGDIIAADLFSSPALFRQLWPKLLDSYVIDALDRPERGRVPDESFVQRWLDGLRRAERVSKDTPGSGSLYELRGAGLLGSALVWDQGVVHIAAFRALSIPEPQFDSLRFRRERLEQQAEPQPAR